MLPLAHIPFDIVKLLFSLFDLVIVSANLEMGPVIKMTVNNLASAHSLRLISLYKPKKPT